VSVPYCVLGIENVSQTLLCILFAISAGGLWAAVEMPFHIEKVNDFERYDGRPAVAISGLSAADLSGLSKLAGATSIQLSAVEIDRDALETLASLRELRELIFLRCKGKDWSHIGVLKGAKALNRLVFRTEVASPVPDPEDEVGLVRGIAALTQLRSLSLHAAAYSDLHAELKELGHLKSLISLSINALDARGVQYLPENEGVWEFLENIEGLAELSLFPGGYSPEFLRVVAALPHLSHLSMEGPLRLATDREFELAHFVTAKDVLQLSEVKSLEKLRISGLPARTSDAVIESILTLPRLRELELGHLGGASGGFLRSLHEAPKLEVLRLISVSLGNEIEGLWEDFEPPKFLREFYVHFGGDGFLKGCLPALARFPSLEALDLHTNKGIGEAELELLTRLVAEGGFPVIRTLKLYHVATSEDTAKMVEAELRKVREGSIDELLITPSWRE